MTTASTFHPLKIRTPSVDVSESGRYQFQKSLQLRHVRGQKFRQVEPQCMSFRGFIFHLSLQSIIYDSMTATSCWWCHIWFFTSFLSPQFQLQEILHCSKRQEDVKKHVLWLIMPQTCWVHRSYVMSDRVLSHQDISSFSFVSSAKWIGRLLHRSFSVRRAVSSFVIAIWGKTNAWPKARWRNRQGVLAGTWWIILKTSLIC